MSYRSAFITVCLGFLALYIALAINSPDYVKNTLVRPQSSNAVYIIGDACVINDNTNTVDADLAFCSAHLRRLP
jgi:hypothetical protein